MGRRSLSLVTAAMIGLAAGQAFAADLPRKAPAYVPPAPPPLYVWTGCYIGANVGGAFAHIDVTDVASGFSGSKSSETSFAGGGQIGCDYQFTGAGWSASATCSTGQTFIAPEHLRPKVVTGAGTVEIKGEVGSML